MSEIKTLKDYRRRQRESSRRSYERMKNQPDVCQFSIKFLPVAVRDKFAEQAKKKGLTQRAYFVELVEESAGFCKDCGGYGCDSCGDTGFVDVDG